jgi:hypothetical protein
MSRGFSLISPPFATKKRPLSEKKEEAARILGILN